MLGLLQMHYMNTG